jgi:hypothetical protein
MYSNNQRNNTMTDEQKLAMEKFGITSETKSVFHFEGYKYDRLEDALKYAKQAAGNAEKSATDSNT